LSFTSKWRSPSNIALIKYWGKYENQVPANPSLSFTLEECHTETSVTLKEKNTDDRFSFEIFLDGKRQESFNKKIEQFFIRIVDEASFLKEKHIEIHTSNSFPHSSGIASSASGMSALALCLLSIKEKITEEKEEEFYQKASEWARLGSGSASRSVYGGLVEWGQHENTQYSSNRWAIPHQGKTDSVFQSFRDTILLVETGAKKVSSTAGHGLMKEHPYAHTRFKQAHTNLDELYVALEKGDLEHFGKIVESEALTLHAMMMTSSPYYLLMRPNTLRVIEEIWEFRKSTSTPAYFTLDAGANVHLLFPESVEQAVNKFVKDVLSPFLQNNKYLCDRVGKGPVKLED